MNAARPLIAISIAALAVGALAVGAVIAVIVEVKP